MSLRFICIEVRRNLRCANVFLQFDHSLTETEFLKIVLENKELMLREYSTATRVSFDEYFTIEARTVSNLTVEECNASFRLTISSITEPKTEEIAGALPTSVRDNVKKSSFVASKPNITEGKLASLLCLNCECELTGVVEFNRVREFPSGSMNINEFFCHNSPNLQDVLVPKLLDFFYGFQFIVLNEELVQKQVKVKGINVYCKRCLKHLGESLLNGKAVKLWADTMRLRMEVEGKDELFGIFEKDDRSLTSQLLNKLVSETSLNDSTTQPLLQQIHFCKVLLEATFPDRQNKFMLVQILEKELEILRNVLPLAHGSHNNNNVLQVQLKSCKSFKILYRLVDDISLLEQYDIYNKGGGTQDVNSMVTTDVQAGCENRLVTELRSATRGITETNAGAECTNPEESELLKQWKSDMSIHSVKISPALFILLLDELELNALLLPEIYRYTPDDFQLSYVFYKN